MLAALIAVQQASFTFHVEGGRGLMVEAAGVPIIRGSYLQYYEPGWTKGYYSTNYGESKVEQVDPATVRVSFASDDKLAHGTVTYHKEGDKLTAHYDLQWEGDHAVKIEAAAGFLWAPALEKGSLTAGGKPTRALNTYAYSSRSIEGRRFSPDAPQYDFSGPLGTVSEHSSIPLTLFDARGNYNDDWAANHEYLWLGTLDTDVSKGKQADFDVEYRFDPKAAPALSPKTESLAATRQAEAYLPDTSRPPLIPKPQTDQLNWDKPLELTGAYSFPAGVFDHLDLYKEALSRRFVTPAPARDAKKVAFDAGISRLGYVPGGYRIELTDHSMSVLGEEDEGLRNGLERLVSLAFVKNGHICLPTGALVSIPQSDWRGVHLFAGKKALAFQGKLWDRVLLPLGFNKVVLQCERTAWTSTPGIESSITMSKPELLKLAGFYKNAGVELIPLVQSFGHMEWFFENKKNLDIAFNPDDPYGVDPRKPRTKEALTNLWNEVIETLKPKTIHFGLDEFDMVGMHVSASEKTQLWQEEMQILGGIAQSHGVRMMLWGDECLAPGEAPDATNGDTPNDAALRRAAIPQGSLIGDWHYISDPNPHSYTKNLQLWKDAGMYPIASAWYQPSNIKGFDTDAGYLQTGTLQTTWNGYESSEEGMLEGFDQYSAMILAADYSWSGRSESPDKLGYDPGQVFRKMYFGEPSPLTASPGFGLGASGQAFDIGQIRYGSPIDETVGSALSSSGASDLKFSVDAKGRELALAAETLVKAADDGEPVAEVTVTLADGRSVVKRLVYGRDIRSADDKTATALSDRNADGLCGIVMRLGETPIAIQSISIKPLNGYTGMRVQGLELIP
ncbi:MAG TPA: hypothetical protein VG944_17865 [Fimbriimonas sp.]|nr:hypothetical protein [Fimbriimonas sp.]